MCDCKTFTGWVKTDDDYYDAEMTCSDCGVGKVYMKNGRVYKLTQNN